MEAIQWLYMVCSSTFGSSERKLRFFVFFLGFGEVDYRIPGRMYTKRVFGTVYLLEFRAKGGSKGGSCLVVLVSFEPCSNRTIEPHVLPVIHSPTIELSTLGRSLLLLLYS